MYSSHTHTHTENTLISVCMEISNELKSINDKKKTVIYNMEWKRKRKI